MIRKALLNEVKKAKAKELEKQIDDKVLSKVKVEDVIESIREDRDNR